MRPRPRHVFSRAHRPKSALSVSAALLLAVALAACGSSGGSSGSQSSLSTKQTIVFATAGLGAEAPVLGGDAASQKDNKPQKECSRAKHAAS